MFYSIILHVGITYTVQVKPDFNKCGMIYLKSEDGEQSASDNDSDNISNIDWLRGI